MNIYAKHGDKVVFTGKNGFDHQQKLAREVLTVGKVYEVDFTEQSNFYSSVKLIGYDQKFNTVMFQAAPEGGE